MRKNTKVFISYCWRDDGKKVSTELLNILKDYCDVRVDTQDLQPFTNINRFIRDSIKECDFIILLIGKEYLLSENCMYEIVELLKENHEYLKGKIIPIVLQSLQKENKEKPYNLFDDVFAMHHYDYWDKQIKVKNKALDVLLNESPDANITEGYEKKKQKFIKIRNHINDFVQIISNMRYSTWQDIKKSNFITIIEKIDSKNDSSSNQKQLMNETINVQSINSQVDIITHCIGIETMPLGTERDIEIEKLKSLFPENRHVLFLAAKNAHKSEKFDMAKYFYTTVLERYPYDSKIWNNLGVLYKDHYQNSEEALKCFKNALEINLSDSYIYTNLASLYADYFNDNENAAINYLKAIDFDPQNPHAYLNYARLLVKYANNDIEQFGKAEKYYKIAIQLDNEIAESYYNLANVQANELKKYEEAKNNYLTAIRLKPDFYQAMTNLASLYLDVFEDKVSAKTYYLEAQSIFSELKVEEIESKI